MAFDNRLCDNAKPCFYFQTKREKGIQDQTGIEIKYVTQIVTNGTLITPEIAQFIAKYQIATTVSLDSPFNPMRFFAGSGISSRTEAIEGLKILLECGAKKVNINMVVPANCVDYIDDIFEYYDKFGFLNKLATVTMSPQAPPIHIDNIDDRSLYTESTAYNAEKCAKFAEKLIEYTQKLNLDLKYYRSKIRSLLKEGGVGYRCPGALWKWSLTPGGEIYPCHMLLNMKRFLMGNIYQDRATLLQSMQSVRKEFAERTVFKANPCNDCLLQTLCMPFVDCPARCYIEKGNLYDLPLHYCLSHKPYLEYLFEEFLWEQIKSKEESK